MTGLRLQLVSGSLPHLSSSRLLLVPPTPGPSQSEASGPQARVPVGACVCAMDKAGPGLAGATSAVGGSASPALA